MEWDVFIDILAVTSPIRMECVRVPAGEFLMGSDLAKDREASKSEQPQHRVYLAEFYIGKYPVTNAQYAAFVRSARYEAPFYWDQEGIPAGKGDHHAAQVGVTQFDRRNKMMLRQGVPLHFGSPQFSLALALAHLAAVVTSLDHIQEAVNGALQPDDLLI